MTNEIANDCRVAVREWRGEPEAPYRAALARDLAGLANAGGGTMPFTVVEGEPPSKVDVDHLIHAIASEYLAPSPRIEASEPNGGVFVVRVFPHGGVPVLMVKDEPGATTSGVVYAATGLGGSRPLTDLRAWDALIERCLDRRVAAEVPFKKAFESFGMDFRHRLSLRLGNGGNRGNAPSTVPANVTLGYAVVAAGGELVRILDPLGFVEKSDGLVRKSIFIQEEAALFNCRDTEGDRAHYFDQGFGSAAYVGWPEPERQLISGEITWWRVREDGIVVAARSQREAERPHGDPFRLYVGWALRNTHALLAHARAACLILPDVERVLVRIDWKEANERVLFLDKYRSPLGKFGSKTAISVSPIPFRRTSLEECYFDCLKAAASPLFNAAQTRGPLPSEWLTRENVEGELTRMRLRLP
jgi:hypothetical protein